MSATEEEIAEAGRIVARLQKRLSSLWEVVGCAEAYFTAETDDEAGMAEREFFAHLAVLRPPTPEGGNGE